MFLIKQTDFLFGLLLFMLEYIQGVTDMKILAAFDSFKESMSAQEAGESVQKAVHCDVMIRPLADGGEGTMEVMNAFLHGEIHEIEVAGPLFQTVKAKLAMIGDKAIIESAQACGLDYLEEEKKNGTEATSYGVGEMMKYAYDHGARHFLITLGGTACNDGGIGLLSGMGYGFFDQFDQRVPMNARGLETLDRIKKTRINLSDIVVEGACDVSNPLYGVEGATYIFGPQKKVQDLKKTDQAMKHYATLMTDLLGRDDSKKPGTGAAGGMGYAILSGLNGHLITGFEAVSRTVHLEEAIQEADLIFTGEGKMDRQTLYGKTPLGVLHLAKKYHKPVVAFCGRCEDKEELLKAGFEDVRCINHTDEPLSILLEKGPQYLEEEVRKYLEEKNV